jgi:uncharacterized protein (TIGR00251 family)
MPWLAPPPEGCVIGVRVVPRASRSEVAGPREGALRIRLQAPPVDGKANRALAEFLADALGTRPSAIVLLGGLTGRLKRVLVRGVTPDRAAAAFGAARPHG